MKTMKEQIKCKGFQGVLMSLSPVWLVSLSTIIGSSLNFNKQVFKNVFKKFFSTLTTKSSSVASKWPKNQF